MQNFTILDSDEILLPLPIAFAMTGMKKTYFYEAIKQGLIAKPHKQGSSSVWPKSEIKRYIKSVIDGTSHIPIHLNASMLNQDSSSTTPSSQL